jgi:spermidine synthase/MFS family permease
LATESPSRAATLVFAGTIFSSAFALFLVQPIIAKQILPWFGGSATVWAICMVFFQVVLLAGYAYSDFLSRHFAPRKQVLIHASLLLISLSFIPIVADAHWKPTGDEDPTLLILRLLLGTIGLPYFLLSTTGPLVQSWVSRSVTGSHVYRYFSLSNLASLLALMCYPFLIEPHAAILGQAWAWSAVYGAFVLLCCGAGLMFMRHAHALPPPVLQPEHAPEGSWTPGLRDMLLWLAAAAMGSVLLVAVTNHITQNVAAIPFLWLLPLTLYLLTFVLCFESDRWYRRRIVLPITAVLMAWGGYALYAGVDGGVWVAIPLYAFGMFFFCMFLHGELAHMRPGPRYLTRFYLMLSLGGALGGILVGLIAPRVLPAYYELGAGMALTALLATVILHKKAIYRLGAWLLVAVTSISLFLQIQDDRRDSRVLERNFYGSLMTLDTHREDPRNDVRQLYHGSVKHGEQFLAADRRTEATAYYGASAGVGLAIASKTAPAKHVGVIGLGAGTLAVYGRTGDTFRMYEIDPAVIDLAQREFSFLADSKAKIEHVVGDARLQLEREADQQFDVLAVDAFSGDSIPVHLITAQAMALYTRHIKADGIIAFHITNRFLWLAPVIQNIAQSQQLTVALIHDENDNPALRNTDWVLVSKDPAPLQVESIRRATSSITPNPKIGVWSDDFNNLFDVLK